MASAHERRSCSPGVPPGSTPRPLGPVLFWFFVRLAAAAAVLYVSLRSLDGKVAALLIGLGSRGGRPVHRSTSTVSRLVRMRLERNSTTVCMNQDPYHGTLNKYFGNLATQVLHAVHVQPYNPQAPITETFAMEILVLGLLLVFFVLVRISLNVEKPGPDPADRGDAPWFRLRPGRFDHRARSRSAMSCSPPAC